MTDIKQVPIPPEQHDDEEYHRALLARAIADLLQGKLYCTGSVTLTDSSATTDVVDRRLGATSVILFQPLTSNAAAEIGNGTMYIQTSDYDIPNRTFTINHANNSQTDRDFYYILIG